MTLIVDAAPLLAFANAADPDHEDVRRVLRSEPGDLVLPAPVTAEVDYGQDEARRPGGSGLSR